MSLCFFMFAVRGDDEMKVNTVYEILSGLDLNTTSWKNIFTGRRQVLSSAHANHQRDQHLEALDITLVIYYLVTLFNMYVWNEPCIHGMNE